MIVRIGAISYHAVIFVPDPECGTTAVKLTKMAHKPEVYHLILNNHGELVCDCPNYEMKHTNMGTVCKHGRALQLAGIIRQRRE